MTKLIDLTKELQESLFLEAEKLKANPNTRLVEAFRIEWLGRKGKITQLFDELKQVSKDERPAFGKALNLLRTEAERMIAILVEAADAKALEQKLNAPSLDITLPVHEASLQQSLHPVTLMRNMLIGVFRRYGFTVYDGPEIDFDFYNFSALNIPDNHPARDMQDTFFVAGHKQLVLRTHTSNIQIHAMLKEKPPIRLVAPGRVYRVDNDATHSPMFHQIECVVVDRGISFAHMKGLIDAFMKSIFGADCATRLRPSYFPFVEPGAEVDLQCTMCKGAGCRVCKQTGWLEIGGCGMVHPNVFEAVQYDSEEYTGFAFGFGIDRMAMLAWQLPDLRQMFEGDSQYSQQFPVYTRPIYRSEV